jgi:hypothetical protein
MPKNQAQLAAEHGTQIGHQPGRRKNRKGRGFLTVWPPAAISFAIGAGRFARANCYGAKRL